MTDATTRPALIDALNKALAWELRACLMYAHFAAYVQGIHRLHLSSYFAGEATESLQHAGIVRDAIAKLGGEAVTNRDTSDIAHTTDYRVMLQASLDTEQHAAEMYAEVLHLLPDDNELYDNLQQILFAEQRSVLELEQMLG